MNAVDATNGSRTKDWRTFERRAGERKEEEQEDQRVKGETQPLALASRRDPIGVLAVLGLLHPPT